MSAVVRISDYRRKPPYLHFSRSELNRLLGLYATRVIRGEWRDYAILHGSDSASFLVFSRSNEHPQFVISKLSAKSGDGRQRNVARHGAYTVSSPQRKLKQGHSLDEVLRIFDRPLQLVSG
jgi:hypothetical protein